MGLETIENVPVEAEVADCRKIKIGKQTTFDVKCLETPYVSFSPNRRYPNRIEKKEIFYSYRFTLGLL